MSYQPPPPPYSGWPHQSASASPPRNRQLVTAALIVVAILVFAGTVAGVLLFWNRDGAQRDRGTAVEGQLRMTYPSEPSAGWRLDADELFQGANFVRPDSISNSYNRPGFIDLGHTLVTQAALPQSDRGLDLVAIDSKTGDIRWQTPLESGVESPSGLDVAPAACASKTVDGQLPCLVEGFVQFFDMSDGSVRRRLAAPERAETVEVHGTDVYTLGYEVMARGTTEDLTASWQRSYTIDPSCPGSGDAQYYGVSDHMVYFGSDAGVVVADVDDGRRLIDAEPQMMLEYPGKGFTGGLCPDFADATQTVVFDAEGHVLRNVDTPTDANGPILVAPGQDVPYLAGHAAYDFATGQQRWAGEPGVFLEAIFGDVVLGARPGNFEGRGGSLIAFDLATGERLWNNNDAGETIGMSDGERVIVGDSEEVAAINLATGQQDWVLSGANIYDLAQAGDGFASSAKESITYYPPTGGPSVAPGRGEPTDGVGTDAEGGLITKCGRVPEMRPVEYRAETGGLVVKMEVKARCPGGDVITTNRMRVTIRDDRGTICSGIFDFSSNPLTLGGEGSDATVIELTFDDGSILRHPNTLGDRSGSDPGATTAAAKGDEVVDCIDEGTSTGQPGGGNQQSTGKEFSSTKDGVGDCGSDAEALEALRVQVDADRPVVQRDLADHWVAQLSAKQPGLVAPDVDGRVVNWTPCEILRQHLRLRLEHPEVRLVWSDEWRTFDLRGWWVTIAGVTFGDANAANRWCDERAIPVDECFAKVVSNSRDSRGSTKYRR